MENIRNKTDIDTFNYKGQSHGYQEWYANAKLFYRGIYRNDLEVGYEEWHSTKSTNFYIR
jgi:hypothetical protein